jgi:exonuclease VII large subunit
VRVLERGYAVVRLDDGTVVRDAAQVGVHSGVQVQLAKGSFGAVVETVTP